jgi:uncharacterized small protein (DUF1192 family)
MASWDDDLPKPKPQVIVGADLSNLSVADLEERIAALRSEIERVEAEMRTKKARAAAADALFKR